jgi:hypothetical protein
MRPTTGRMLLRLAYSQLRCLYAATRKRAISVSFDSRHVEVPPHLVVEAYEQTYQNLSGTHG